MAVDALDDECAVRASFDALIGNRGYSFSNFELLPRSKVDVGFVNCVP